jgi:hypothetical protein
VNERFPWTTVIAVGVVAWLLAFVGFSLGPERPGLLGVLDNAWRSFALFAMQSTPDDQDHWLVVVARLLAPGATLGWVYGLTRDYLTRSTLAWRLRGLQGHLVIVGLGSRGRAFRDSCKTDVATLDIRGIPGRERRVDSDVIHQRGDGRDLQALKRLGVDRARSVLILTGDDAVNLEVLGRVIACRGNVRSPLSIAVRLQNPTLVRQLDRQDEFVRRGVGHGVPQTKEDAQIEVALFDGDRMAARQLLRDHPLVDVADLRGQRRVHAVVIGWTGFALAFLEQLARVAPYKDFDSPRVDLMVTHPDRVRFELEAVQWRAADLSPRTGRAEQPSNAGPDQGNRARSGPDRDRGAGNPWLGRSVGSVCIGAAGALQHLLPMAGSDLRRDEAGRGIVSH